MSKIYLGVTEHLPRRTTRDDLIRTPGYVVLAGDPSRPSVHFFEALEPAFIYGRAARMSYQCSGYSIHQATHELVFNRATHRDQERIYYNNQRDFAEADAATEAKLVRRFADRLDHTSSHWPG